MRINTRLRMRTAVLRTKVEAKNIGGVLYDKKKRAVIFIALARIALANCPRNLRNFTFESRNTAEYRTRSGI